MKKSELKNLLLIPMLCAALITGCGSKEVEITKEDYTITDGSTAAGIKVGSEFADFAEAYGDFPLQILGEDGDYISYTLPDLKKDETAGNEDMTLMAACFFEDGQAVTTSQLLEETGASAEDLGRILTGQDYLSEHTLVYRYMIFDFSDGKVTGLTSDCLDYNTELEQ